MSQSTEVAAPTRAATRPLKDCETLAQAFQTKEFSERIAASAPSQIKPNALLRSFIQATTRSPDLLKVDFRQAVGGFLTLSELGLALTPTLGQAYMIPFKGRKKVGREWVEIMTMQIIIGYQGLIDLSMRSGQVGGIHSEAVYKGDDFDYEFGTNQFLRHRPKYAPGSSDISPELVWAIGHLRGDVKPPFEVIPWNKILKTRDGSQGYMRAVQAREEALKNKWGVPKTYTEAPWVKFPEAMAKKTVIRQLSKMLPKSVELQGAMAVDEPDRGWVDFGPVIDGVATAADGLPLEDDEVDPGAGFGIREGAGDAPPTAGTASKPAATATTADAAPPAAAAEKRGPGRPPKQKPAEDIATPLAEEEPPPASEGDYGDAKAGAPQVDSTPAAPANTGFAANVFDHTGDYATDEMTTPDAWTTAYIAVLQGTPAADREQLRDNNIETMGGLLIGDLDRIMVAEKALAAPPPQESTPTRSPAAPPFAIIDAPAGRDGRPDWKAFVELVREALPPIGVTVQPSAWIAAHIDALKACPPAQRVQAVKLITEHYKGIGQGIPAGLSELIRPPRTAPSTEPSPGADPDSITRKYFEDRKQDLMSFKTHEEVKEYGNRDGLKARMADAMLTDFGKELARDFNKFLWDRYYTLGGPKNTR